MAANDNAAPTRTAESTQRRRLSPTGFFGRLRAVTPGGTADGAGYPAGPLLGMALLLVCMIFFATDVVSDIAAHGGRLSAYTRIELVHQAFEALAVVALAHAALSIRAHMRRQTEVVQRDGETIAMLRGHFDQVLARRFEAWGLTPAERDVTILIIRGLSIADIAAARKTAQGTVKAQSGAIFRKIGVGSKSELLSLLIDEFLDSDAKPAGAPHPDEAAS